MWCRSTAPSLPPILRVSLVRSLKFCEILIRGSLIMSLILLINPFLGRNVIFNDSLFHVLIWSDLILFCFVLVWFVGIMPTGCWVSMHLVCTSSSEHNNRQDQPIIFKINFTRYSHIENVSFFYITITKMTTFYISKHSILFFFHFNQHIININIFIVEVKDHSFFLFFFFFKWM